MREMPDWLELESYTDDHGITMELPTRMKLSVCHLCKRSMGKTMAPRHERFIAKRLEKAGILGINAGFLNRRPVCLECKAYENSMDREEVEHA